MMLWSSNQLTGRLFSRILSEQPVHIDIVISGNMPQIWADSLVNHLNHSSIVFKYR